MKGGRAMKALVKVDKGPGNIAIRDIPKPQIPYEDWVLIKVKASGICGTDIHIWHDKFSYWPPVVLGHEFSGEIVEIVKAVQGFKIGDRIVAEPHTMACGRCELCRQGRRQLCESKRSPGWGIDGSFTDYIVMPSLLLHHIPNGVPYELAALAEPMAITFHQVLERGRVECQDFVVITGAGPIGILSAFMAKAAGAAKVIITGTGKCESVRFGLAKELGADHTINVEKENAIDRVIEMTGGKGADVLIETSGAASAIAQSVEMVKKYGRISAIGITERDMVSLPWNKAINKVIDIYFNMSSSYTAWDRALSLISENKEKLSKVITHKTAIDKWEWVFNELIEERGVKALFIPSDS
jgi:L-iditol 2-dehydrogenase